MFMRCRLARREDRHLRRRADRRDPPGRRAGSARRSRSARATARAQAWNSRARPLEAMVPVPELRRRAGSRSARCTRGSAWSRPPCGPGELEQHALEGGEARRIEMLDHLHHGRGVEAGQALVAVGQRAVEQRDALPLLAAGGPGAAARARVSSARYETSSPTISRRTACSSSSATQQLALAAAEVEHAPRAALLAAPRPPRRGAARCRLHRPLDRLFLACVLLLGRRPGRRLRRRSGGPAPRGQAAADASGSARDQLALGMRGQPALAVAQQLLHLVVADPVVLVVVQHRDQHIEVREQVAQAQSCRAA